MTISLSGSTYDGAQAQSPFPLCILLARQISDSALAEVRMYLSFKVILINYMHFLNFILFFFNVMWRQYPVVYRFNRARVLTSSTRVDGSHQAQANFILPDISKLAMEAKSGLLTVLIVKCGM